MAHACALAYIKWRRLHFWKGNLYNRPANLIIYKIVRDSFYADKNREKQRNEKLSTKNNKKYFFVNTATC